MITIRRTFIHAAVLAALPFAPGTAALAQDNWPGSSSVKVIVPFTAGGASDVLTRLHAATKPQVLGLATVLLAIVLQVPTWGVLTTVVLVMTFQLLTQPMTAHMLGRSAYRSDHVRRDLLIEDDLGHDIEEHDQEEDAAR